MEIEMFQLNEDLKAILTPAEARIEMIGGIIFVFSFPVLMLAMWIITPA
jgi:hypothetical protein